MNSRAGSLIAINELVPSQGDVTFSGIALNVFVYLFLCTIPVKDKAEVLMQVEQLTEVKDELTEQVNSADFIIHSSRLWTASS